MISQAQKIDGRAFVGKKYFRFSYTDFFSRIIFAIRGFRKSKGGFSCNAQHDLEALLSPRGHEASTGVSPSYPLFLRRNPPKHLPSSFGGSLNMKSVSKKQGFVKCKPPTTDLGPWLWGAALTGRSEHSSPRLRTGRSVVRGKACQRKDRGEVRALRD